MASARPSPLIDPAQRGRLLADVVRPPARQRPAAGALVPSLGLDGGARLRVVDALLAVLGGAYCHLVQKRAAYAVDPVQALTLLRARTSVLSDAEFHLAVTGIVAGLRDAHTRYAGPQSLQGQVAMLPFLVEQYGPHSNPTFIASKVGPAELIGDARFVPGVELHMLNGVPFARAVDIYADRQTGGRPDARRARALESLTLRPLQFEPPPDEHWVDVGFRTARGAHAEVRIPWRVIAPGAAPSAISPGSHASRCIAASPAGEQARRAKKLLFSTHLWQSEGRARGAASAAAAAPDDGWLPTPFQDTLAARPVRVPGVGEIGLLRVWSFDVDDDDAFLAEVVRLLALLPQRGLVIDLRGNPGGLIWAAERMLQLFTDRPIEPVRFSLVSSPLTRAMASSPFNRLEFEAWEASLALSVSTGEPYSQALPITEPEWCNDLGRAYPGPVVCVADCNTYSSGDLFAAGFVDNEIGPLVCVGEATGAGGANVWTHFDLREALDSTAFALPELPHGIGFTLAIRRATRARASAGLPIEDLGVRGVPYVMTRDDLLGGNQDLIAFCARLLGS
jgi:hypothetical protein